MSPMVEHVENGRFKVQTNKRSPIWFVDVNYQGRFRCDCSHFRIRIGPRLERGEKLKRPFCKHCEFVVRFLGTEVVNKMRAENVEGHQV